LTAITGIGGTYKTMEDRVSDLESRLQKQEQVLRVEIEVQKMRQEQIIDELKSKARIDSMRFAAEMVQQEYLIKLQSME
jgi:NMD protein affecting ribosome stability and mRNA decay